MLIIKAASCPELRATIIYQTTTDTDQVDNLTLKQLGDNVSVGRFITTIRHRTHRRQ